MSYKLKNHFNAANPLHNFPLKRNLHLLVFVLILVFFTVKIMLQSIEIKPLVEVMNVDLESPNSVNFEPHILAKL